MNEVGRTQLGKGKKMGGEGGGGGRREMSPMAHKRKAGDGQIHLCIEKGLPLPLMDAVLD